MNRAERRRAGKQDKPKTYVLTGEQIENMKRDAANKATETAFKMFLSIPCMVLHDKFGFGKVRRDRFTDYCMVWFEAVQSGETSLAEIVKIAENLSGITIVEGK